MLCQLWGRQNNWLEPQTWAMVRGLGEDRPRGRRPGGGPGVSYDARCWGPSVAPSHPQEPWSVPAAMGGRAGGGSASHIRAWGPSPGGQVVRVGGGSGGKSLVLVLSFHGEGQRG